MSKIESKSEDDSSQIGALNQNVLSTSNPNKITFDQIASVLLKQNFILTALELHTELAETGRELPRLRDYFSNPANFEQQNQSSNNNNLVPNSSSTGFYPLHKASSIQTFDSLDLTRYSDDVDQNKFQDDKIAVLEFELRKAKETINQLRNTLTLATENQSSNMSKSSLNCQNLDQSDKAIFESNSNNNSKSNLQVNTNGNKNLIFNLNENDYEEEHELQDELAQSNNNEIDNSKLNIPKNNLKNHKLMPHDKNAINFLINEYLLENNYKMTSVTFSEENESQDLEDWDVVGLNRSKPPNLFQLYKLYLNKTKLNEFSKPESAKKEAKIQAVQKIEAECQTEINLNTISTNTDEIVTKNFESLVNFDKDAFENQKMQINKLLEKQEILIKSLSKLESEISTLNLERENNLKKIDLLTVSLDKTKSELKLVKDKANNENNIEKIQNGHETAENFNNNINTNDEEKESDDKNETNERKIPVVFKEILNKYSIQEINSSDSLLIDEMSNLKIDNSYLISLLFKYLPIITPYVSVEKRLELLPILLTCAILEQEEISKSNNKKDSTIINLMFNLFDRPNEEQRLMILTACIKYTKYVGPIFVNNYLLSLCWENLNEKVDEKRILVADACSTLAPFIYNDIRSSLMFSILNQIIEQEASDIVKVYAVKSLAILINYIKDEQKFLQCLEILDLCITESNDSVLAKIEELLMPCLSLWALNINKFSDLIMHLLNKADFHMIATNKQKYKRVENDINFIDHENIALNYMNLLNLNIQFIFGYILIHFRDNSNVDNGIDSVNLNNKLPKLNSYFHSLQNKLNIKFELFKLDSFLEDYLSLTIKYMGMIQSDLWSSIELSNAFSWLSDCFLRKLIQMSAQIEAKDQLTPLFVNLFRNFTLLFSIDYDLIKSKIIPIFEKFLSIPEFDSENNQQTIFDQILSNKSCPLYKSTLPVYFVGILSTLIDVEIYGWFSLCSELDNDLDESLPFKTESSPSSITSEKVISSSSSKSKTPSKKQKDETGYKPQTSLEKRIDHMTNYLKNIFFALSLNQSSFDGVIEIYELMKVKAKSSDYVIQMLLSTLWDGIVHISLYVRCNTAKLFEILVKDCDEYLLSTRILPALITLANDLDKMVRCSSISPLTSIIENCTNKEILERVYTQLQSFLSDPILKDEYLLQIELIKTFRRISTRVNSKFREEFILPYLTILTMNVKNVINDNDYEFTLSALTSSFLSISSLNQFSISDSPSNSSISSMNSINNNQLQLQSQQQDLIKICVLLFDTYQKICLSTDEYQKSIYISRQSIQESLLPGLSCLKDIFRNHIIINNNLSGSATNTHNDYVSLLDNMIHKLEYNQSQNIIDSTTSPMNNSSSNSNSLTQSPSLNSYNKIENSVSPSKLSPGKVSNEVLNFGLNTLSSSSTSSISSNSTITSTNQNGLNSDNTNFKSFVFKGINSFKDQSKDKLSNFLLTNRNFKK